MSKICSIIGARPQFIKAGPLSAALREKFVEIMIHTGQHYDHGMSQRFFDELHIPEPDYNLGVGSGGHGAQTAAMLKLLEELYVKEKPDAVIVYGDTNSTLAGALAAVKLHIPVAHVEAGLRSFNREMPEEINRLLTDHISRWLFTPSEASKKNLKLEGITDNVHIVGDIMLDSVLKYSEKAKKSSSIMVDLDIEKNEFYLATVHRAENTDDKIQLETIFQMFSELDKKVILPLHPRTKNRMEEYSLEVSDNIKIIEPAGYLDMLHLIQCSKSVLTDSGGIQKEAYYLETPCITLRKETEWTETVDAGWNTVTNSSKSIILSVAERSDEIRLLPHPDLYGNGNSAAEIVNILSSEIS